MHKQNTFTKAMIQLFLIIALTIWIPTPFMANTTYINTTTEYKIYLDDWADLLPPEDEKLLLELMEKVSEYGNVAFVSIAQNPVYSTDTYAENYYYEHFGTDSGTVFFIDMDERMIWLETGGQMEKTITRSYALTITDNIYSYASDGEYYLCAKTAFEQILTLMEGSRITQPMKYICNAFLALAIALLSNYFLAMFLSRAQKASDQQILSGIDNSVDIHNTRADFLHQTKRYSPQSSGSGKGGGRSSGGGGRSSGGGHRF